MRNNHFANYPNGSSCHCRAVALSSDGGASFAPLTWDATLVSPVCAAGLSTAGGALLFSNPDDRGAAHQSSRYRDHGVIRKSFVRTSRRSPAGFQSAVPRPSLSGRGA